MVTIDHLNIVVSDLQKSLNFYCNILGFTETRRAFLKGEWIDKLVDLDRVEAEVVYILAPGGEPRIELLCYHRPRGERVPQTSVANTHGLRHFALRVDNLDALLKKIRGAGIRPLGQVTTVPPGVVKHDAGEKTLVYLQDPDGVIVELAEYSLYTEGSQTDE